MSGSARAPAGSGPQRVVEGEQLRRVLAGQAPSGADLRQSPVPVRSAGYDLTLSAPKSVSVMFALGDGEVRLGVGAAHDKAVREAFAYAERTAAAVRRGAGRIAGRPLALSRPTCATAPRGKATHSCIRMSSSRTSGGAPMVAGRRSTAGATTRRRAR